MTGRCLFQLFSSQFVKQVHGKHNRGLTFDHLFIIRAAGFEFRSIQVKKSS